MFLQNCWYVAGWSHQFAQAGLTARPMLGQALVFYRTDAGRLVALEDRCCHRFAPLSKGRLEGDDLRCMYHGLKFSPDGKCIEIPGQEAVPPSVRVRSYPVVERDRWVWVWMGDAALADPAMIPDALGHDSADYVIEVGELAYRANYQLINDNLLDLSHLSYVHEKTLGRGSTQWGSVRPRITPVPRGLLIQRWIENHTPPSTLHAPAGSRFDQWSTYHFLVPGVFLLYTKFCPVGTAKASGMAAPSIVPPYELVTSQAVTPIDETNTVYYFSGGLLARHSTQDDAKDQLKRFFAAFLEDQDIIQAQQQVIERSQGDRMITLGFDGAVIQFRRLMDSMIAAEASQQTAAAQ